MPLKLRSTLALVAMVALGWIVGSQSTSTAQDPSRQDRWQYHVDADSAFNQERANVLGGKGWELVTVYNQGSGVFKAIYKRKS